MDEAQVKSAILAHIRKSAGRGRKPVVTAEFTLGSSGSRADLAVFADQTIGIEIKTERDTLRRLPFQMQAYCRYFQHAIAIVAPRHLPKIADESLSGASLWTYDAHGNLGVVREGQTNSICAEALCDLLTQAEKGGADFLKIMEDRYGETSRRFWQAVARRSIRPVDLTLLSRFADSREEARRFAAKREAGWNSWLAAQGFA